MKKEFYTYTTLKELGFTDKLINTYFPNPVLKLNPHYASGPKMRTYDKEEINEFMKTEIFKNHMKKKKERLEKLNNTKALKQQKITEFLNEEINKIIVHKVNYDDLFYLLTNKINFSIMDMYRHLLK